MTLPTLTWELCSAVRAHPKCHQKRTSPPTPRLQPQAATPSEGPSLTPALPPLQAPPPPRCIPPFLLYLLIYPLTPITRISLFTCSLQLTHLLQAASPEPGKHTRGKIQTLKHFLCSRQHTDPRSTINLTILYMHLYKQSSHRPLQNGCV